MTPDVARSRYDPSWDLQLEGRRWQLLLGPQTGESERMSMSITTFPPRSAPPLHVHPVEEEMVYVLSGHGRLVTTDEAHPLEAGVALRITPGLQHVAVNDGDDELRLLCVFSPPVVPGSYDRGATEQTSASGHAQHPPRIP